MIDISAFLKNNSSQIKNLISEFSLNQEFSSHDFIEKFSAEFESEYIDMLVNYQKDGKAFQRVHSVIAKHLTLNIVSFGLEKTERKSSENVHGKLDNIQWWKRVN